jgi:hypothetical protein
MPGDPPTGPATGTVDGYPFSIAGSYAFWAKNGPPYLWVELSSYNDDCRQAAFPPAGGTVIGIQIPKNLLVVGRYEATDISYLVNKTGVAMSAGAYPPGDAGSLTNWSADLQNQGVVWITSASDTQIAGAFWASIPRLNISASGTFIAPICGSGDAGALDAARD